MIRWLLLVLIVVNLGIFAWGMHHELRPQEAAAEPSPVPSLVLLSEPAGDEEIVSEDVLPESPGEPRVPVADSATPEAADRETATTQTESPPPAIVEAPVTAAGPDSGVETPAAAEAPDTISESAPEEDSPEEPEPQAEAATESNAEPLAPPESAGPEPATADAGAAVEEPAVCYALGPFPKRDGAETLLAGLRADGLSVGIRQEQREEQKGFWVVIPPLASRQEAVAEVNALKAKGITDVWRFNKGDLANAISLGLFARTSQAETQQQALAKKGITAEVRPRYVERAAYWVDTAPSTDPGLGAALAARMERDYPDLTSEPVACSEL